MKFGVVLLVQAALLRRRTVTMREASSSEFYLAEQLYPRSYVQPMRSTVGGAERAQWLADWRTIAECFARFQVKDGDLEHTRVASVLRDACLDELSFMPETLVEKSGRLPSPFALSLVDAAFCAAHARPDRYARMREYVLAQYVPGRGAEVSERLGAHRVANAARGGRSTSAVGRWFDPASPEFDAMVRCHNVEFPVKYPDWRSRALRDTIFLHGPLD